VRAEYEFVILRIWCETIWNWKNLNMVQKVYLFQ